jgi:predicted GNAT superfamily acetyltransferase
VPWPALRQGARDDGGIPVTKGTAAPSGDTVFSVAAGWGAPPLTVAVLRSPEDCARCELIYREAFGLAPDDGSLNARLLIGLSRNSGMVIGAHAGGELVGFALSFLARNDGDGRLYQYSQTAAVRPGWQGRGVGRAMKFGQRSAALAAGIDLVRWTFDPLLAVNAHFNLDVLGAVATSLARDLYGPMAAPDDRGEPTDRFVVDWELRDPAVETRAVGAARAEDPVGAAAGPRPGTEREPVSIRAGELRAGELRAGELRAGADTALLGIPADWRRFRRSSPPAAGPLRDRILGHAQQLMSAGLAAVSCTRLDRGTAVYRFARREPRQR